MPDLAVVGSRFPGPYASLNGPHTIAVSKQRLLKFAVNIGVPKFYSASPSAGHAATLGAYKALAIRCAIEFTTKRLSRPGPYSLMDPSEKANISYWTGMTLASLVAERLLRVAQLVHVSALFRSGNVTFVSSTSKRSADLLGYDANGAWHVLEAKARQTYPSWRQQRAWKSQATNIVLKLGPPPATRSVCFTHVGAQYAVSIDDPPDEELFGDDRPGGPGRVDVIVELTQGAILSAYYGPAAGWLSESADVRNIERGGVRLAMGRVAFDAVDDEFVYWGMTQNALAQVRRGELPEWTQPIDLEDTYVGADGIAVITSRANAVT